MRWTRACRARALGQERRTAGRGPLGALLAVLGALTLGSSGGAAPLFVGPTCPFATLEAAVAASLDGDVIHLVTGNDHVGGVEITGRSLQIRGGASDCSTPGTGGGESVLRGPFPVGGRVLDLSGDAGDVVELSGLRIIGGRVPGGAGGGLRVRGEGFVLRLQDVTVGGPGSEFNQAASGGGLAVLAGARLEAEEVGVWGNRAAGSGGGLVLDGAELSGTSITFLGNVAGGVGGGVYAASGALDLESSSFGLNAAGVDGPDRGGGLAVTPSASVRIDRASIFRNSGASGGGFACVDDGSGASSTIQLRSAQFIGNATLSRGSALFLDCPSTTVVVATSLRPEAAEVPSVFLDHPEPGPIVVVQGGVLRFEGTPLQPIAFESNVSADPEGMVVASGGAVLSLRHVTFRFLEWDAAALIETRGPATSLQVDFVEWRSSDARHAIRVEGPATVRSSRFLEGGYETVIRNDGDRELLVESVLADELTVDEALIRSDGPLRVAHATMGRIDAPGALLVGSGRLLLASSLLTEPEVPSAGFRARTVDCVLAADAAQLGPATRSGPLGPPGLHFVDAPAGDFSLLPTSGAVDACDASVHVPGPFDVEGDSRVFVLRHPSTPLDLGADEYGTVLFRDGFESGSTAAWNGGS